MTWNNNKDEDISSLKKTKSEVSQMNNQSLQLKLGFLCVCQNLKILTFKEFCENILFILTTDWHQLPNSLKKKNTIKNYIIVFLKFVNKETILYPVPVLSLKLNEFYFKIYKIYFNIQNPSY